MALSPGDNGTEMNLSFAGCGFLGIYHVGVASCIKEHAPHIVTHKIAGASAGAIAAVGLICNVDLGKATTQVLQVALKARSYALGPLHPTFNIVNFVEGLLDDFLPFNAHELATGRMHISLTRMHDRKNVVVNRFDTRDDLIQALICSSYIPFYCGLFPPQYKGTYYLDGGLSDNIPILDEHTITVSPFAGESDICPSDNSASDLHVFLANTSIQLSTSNLYRFGCIVFPPRPETLSKMCQQGFDDCLVFLQKNTLISCKRHLSIYTSVTRDTPFPEPQLEKVPDVDAAADTDEVLSYDVRSNESSDEDSDCDDLTAISSSSYSDSVTSDEENNFGDSEQEEEEDICEDCSHRRHVAVIQSLPQPVVTALQTATDSVNSTIVGRLYKFKALRALGVIVSPWWLSLEVTCNLSRRFYKWTPYMPSDMTWFLKEFFAIIQELYEFLQASRHRYSARFTCQLAITDIDYPCESPRHSLPTFFNRQKHIRNSAVLPVLEKRHSLNLGFTVDLKNIQHQDPIECVNEFRQQLLGDNDKDIDLTELTTGTPEYKARMEHIFTDEHGKTHIHLPKVSQVYCHRHNGKNSKSHRSMKQETNKNSKNENSSITNDTFDNCLHVASQMESILSYYYTDEGNPQTVKVAEIYALGDTTGPRPETSVTDLSLAWDSYIEIKQENSSQSNTKEQAREREGSVCDRLFSKLEEETILRLGEDLSSSSQPFALLGDLSQVQRPPSLYDGSNEMSSIDKDVSLPISDRSTGETPCISTPKNCDTSKFSYFKDNIS